jgi:peroxiredoxin
MSCRLLPKYTWLWCGLAVLGGMIWSVWSPALAQEATSAASPFRLPDQPAAWVNAGPISLSALKGKAAVLWFYEEQCPNCRNKWPGLYETAKSFEGKPIVFIAVNSGNPRGEVEQYAREVSLRWPVIVDTARQFEKQCGVNEVSLQNIFALGMILPDGTFAHGNPGDVSGAAEKALSGASWKVDPAEVPAALRPAWQAVEFGNPAAGASPIKRNLNSPKPELKAAATKLHEAVQTEIQADVASATEALAADRKWAAYEILRGVKVRFVGYELPAEVVDKLKELAADDEIKREIVAAKTLEAAQKQILARNPAALRNAALRLRRLVADYPGTDAAAQAEALLAKLDE